MAVTPITVTPELDPLTAATGATVPTMRAMTLGGDSFIWTGRDFVTLLNGGAAPVNVVMSSVACSHGRTLDKTIAVPAAVGGVSGHRLIARPPKEFMQADGTVLLTAAAVDVVVGVITQRA